MMHRVPQKLPYKGRSETAMLPSEREYYDDTDRTIGGTRRISKAKYIEIDKYIACHLRKEMNVPKGFQQQSVRLCGRENLDERENENRDVYSFSDHSGPYFDKLSEKQFLRERSCSLARMNSQVVFTNSTRSKVQHEQLEIASSEESINKETADRCSLYKGNYKLKQIQFRNPASRSSTNRSKLLLQSSPPPLPKLNFTEKQNNESKHSANGSKIQSQKKDVSQSEENKRLFQASNAKFSVPCYPGVDEDVYIHIDNVFREMKIIMMRKGKWNGNEPKRSPNSDKIQSQKASISRSEENKRVFQAPKAKFSVPRYPGVDKDIYGKMDNIFREMKMVLLRKGKWNGTELKHSANSNKMQSQKKGVSRSEKNKHVFQASNAKFSVPRCRGVDEDVYAKVENVFKEMKMVMMKKGKWNGN